MRKTKAEAERTKQKLLDSALEVMSERSYTSVSMTEIAERIGYSKGAVYWHFRNKHDLLIKVVETACAKSDEELKRTVDGEYGLDGLRRYYKYVLSVVLRSDIGKMLHRLMLHRQEWPVDVREKINRVLISGLDNERKAIEKILISQQNAGKIRKDISAREISALVSAVFQGMFLLQVEEVFYKVDFSRHIDFVFDAIQDKLLDSAA